MKNNFYVFSVVYNNVSDTITFCESLATQINNSSFKLNCCLIDNSTDKEISNKLDRLILNYDFITILRPAYNLGYFGAFNFGLAANFHKNSDYTLLCNNDLVFLKDFFFKLSLKNYSNDIFSICPDIVTFDGVHQNPHVIKPLNLIGRFKLDLYFSNYYIACFLNILKKPLSTICNLMATSTNINSDLHPIDIHMGIGACYIVPTFFLNKEKKLIYPFFLYGEEAFFSKQIHDAGGRLIYDADLFVLHAESATLSKLPKRITYNYAREGYSTYRKFY
jgi:GT2 family glycosyltransferase